MNIDFVFTMIKGKNFFTYYAPSVINWKHKMRGKDGRNNELVFTLEDEELIKKGLEKLFSDLVSEKPKKKSLKNFV